MYIVGIDLGGTQIRVGLFSDTGQLIDKRATLTLAQEGPDNVIERLITFIQAVITENSADGSVSGIGIGSPGPLDVFEGVIKSPPNLPGWVNIPLRQILENQFNVPVYLNNDANAAVLGEYFHGGGKGKKNVVYLTISTGVGSGVIDNGQLQLGGNGSAAEVGHMIINPLGPLCGCGNKGCVEAYVSGTGIVNRMKKVLEEEGRASLLREMDVTTKAIFDAAQKYDPLALQLVEETRSYLGVALVNIIHLYNPEIIIFGGGVSKVGDYLFQPAIEFAKKKAMKPMADEIEFVQAQLGGDVGLIGAASLVTYHQS
ncbi:ROK family protein [Halalkalibacter urbisdiaboli]|uniref:ROK family protein n=1 Tax=Halalkalibacter urbisdiaboli TaxID=1960589 RepID=UPI000B43EF00|nr:ROK family protein [Halalkalibacter urbisdiaboli]